MVIYKKLQSTMLYVSPNHRPCNAQCKGLPKPKKKAEFHARLFITEHDDNDNDDDLLIYFTAYIYGLQISYLLMVITKSWNMLRQNQPVDFDFICASWHAGWEQKVSMLREVRCPARSRKMR